MSSASEPGPTSSPGAAGSGTSCAATRRTGYQGWWSLEIFNDRFRAGARRPAADQSRYCADPSAAADACIIDENIQTPIA